MKRTMAATVVVSAVLALMFLGGTSAGAAPARPTRPAPVAAKSTPWVRYGTYSTSAECGRVGHYLVDHDVYADYTCSRDLAGYELWVHR
ncbi:hypothetical protein [Streptomyces sioyaensis]|uniref:hypothetical protein n=1 Tax=Streptomyces sioyaensis TaxID=67364 RepID=UPI0037A69FD7